jgi:hypothetical protein
MSPKLSGIFIHECFGTKDFIKVVYEHLVNSYKLAL